MISYVSWLAFLLYQMMLYCVLQILWVYIPIPHDEGLIEMKKALDLQKGNRISTNSLIELAEYVLKNNIFEHNPSFYKQLRGIENGRKIPPLYAVISNTLFPSLKAK